MASVFIASRQKSSFPLQERVFRTVGNVTFRLPYCRRPPFVSIVKTSPADGKEQKLQTKREKIKTQNKMLKYALLDYVPQRYMRKANFETQETDRHILDFKQGYGYATKWASRLVGKALSSMDLKDTIIVCIPASCKRTNDRRYKNFSASVCAMCGAINGFEHVQVVGKREKVHISHKHQQEDNVKIDADFFQGRRVIVVDDICTTCHTANAFIERMQAAGADVRLALFLAKTKNYRRTNYYN